MQTDDPPKRGFPIKPHGFGQRVRTARAYAGGITRAELSTRIERAFEVELPKYGLSATTIKRLESGEAVRGTIEDWARRISAVTHVPEWFLLGDWEGAAAIIEEAPYPHAPAAGDAQIRRLDLMTRELSMLAHEIRRTEQVQQETYERWLLDELPQLLQVEPAPALREDSQIAPRIISTLGGEASTEAVVEGLMNPDVSRELKELGDALQQELDRRDPQEARRALANAKARRSPAGAPKSGAPAPELSEADASLVARAIHGDERLSGEDHRRVRGILTDFVNRRLGGKQADPLRDVMQETADRGLIVPAELGEHGVVKPQASPKKGRRARKS